MSNSSLAPTPALPWRFSTRTTDLDLANAQGIQTYYPLRMEILGRSDHFMMSIDAMQLGPTLVGDCRFDAAVTMNIGELQSFYHVNIPLWGHLDSTHRQQEITATPELAAVYGPLGGVRLNRWDAGSRILCIKIRRESLEAKLESLLHRSVNGPIDLRSSIDVTHGYGKVLRDLACLLAGQINHTEPLVRHEIIGEELWCSVLGYFLAATDHPYREALLVPARPCRAPAVNRVVEAMRAAPQRPFDAAALASIAGVSIRALQAAFNEHLGMPPMTYLRNLRLDGAHEELLASDPSRRTTGAVARNWGFIHMGRFAAAYAQKYGVRPSETLRSAGFPKNRAHIG